MLLRQAAKPLTLMIFDVLSVDGESVTAQPYRKRRRFLEELQLDALRWRTPAVSDDGEALWQAVCEHELEGVVAKRRSGRYTSGKDGLETVLAGSDRRAP